MKGDVEWYRQHGRYPNERITKSGVTDEEYLIGDESWNDNRPHKPERVEERLNIELGPWVHKRRV